MSTKPIVIEIDEDALFKAKALATHMGITVAELTLVLLKSFVSRNYAGKVIDDNYCALVQLSLGKISSRIVMQKLNIDSSEKLFLMMAYAGLPMPTLPEEETQKMADHLRRVLKLCGKDLAESASDVEREVLEEDKKVQECPGIIFTDGATGRRARIAGTGIDVWEVIRDYKGMDDNFGHLKEAYHWLTEKQLKAALAYYDLYRDEIDSRLLR